MQSWKVCLVAAAFHFRAGLGQAPALRGGGGNASEKSSLSHEVGGLAFLDELEEIFGLHHIRRSSEMHLRGMSRILLPTYQALPKTAGGGLSAAGARFVIHRLFMQRDGWQVKGLSPAGGSWLPTGSVLGVGDKLPANVRTLFEEKFGNDNFDLEAITLIAAALESTIHSEVVERLNTTYRAAGQDPTAVLNENDAMDIVYMCLTAYLTGGNLTSFSREQFENEIKTAEKTSPEWSRLKTLARQVQAPNITEYRFSDLAKILEGVNHLLGQQVDETVCQELEDKLINIQEKNGSGRVRLADFYSSGLNTQNWQFQHSPEFLRQAGALDESDPSVPRIIIPNFLTMKSHCLGISKYYDLCCIDLCEDLFDQLEEAIRAPHATVDEIVAVMPKIESAYVSAGRNVSDSMRKKLQEVADHHGGQVPLHGRLFAQWMHFAYSNECPYPHVSGTTKVVSDKEWLAETGLPVKATEEEMQSVIDSSKNASKTVSSCDDSEDGMCMWSPEEELVDGQTWREQLEAQRPSLQEPVPPSKGMRSSIRMFAFVAVLGSSLMAMWSAVKQSMSPIRSAMGLKDGKEKPAYFAGATISASV